MYFSKLLARFASAGFPSNSQGFGNGAVATSKIPAWKI